MSDLEVGNLAKQIKLSQNKGLFLVEGLAPDFAQAVADKVGVVVETSVKGGKLSVRTYTSHESDLDDQSMFQILDIFGELEPESKRMVEGGEDIYLLDLRRGYELMLDTDSYLQQHIPVLADPDLLEQIKRFEARQ